MRLIRRSAPGAPIPGVEWIQGDATDRSVVDRVCEGAEAVYNCANPPDYARWDGILQPLFRSIWNGAARSGARMVQLDNLYMYGRPPTSPFSEQTPMVPCSPYGELRKLLFDELWQRHASGDLIATVGHASDYFGPRCYQSAVFRKELIQGIVRGGTVFCAGKTDTPHGYTYVPDAARALAILGTHPKAAGRAWHLPTAATLDTQTLLRRFAAHAGTTIRIVTLPGWLLRLLGLVSPLIRAVAIMRYQWDIPYVPDDRDFRETFGMDPTPLDEAIDATLGAFE